MKTIVKIGLNPFRRVSFALLLLLPALFIFGQDEAYVFHSCEIVLSGFTNIAGVSQAIRMDLIATVISNGTIIITANHKLKFSTCQISPDRSWMGALQTRDDISVNFVFGVKPHVLTSVNI